MPRLSFLLALLCVPLIVGCEGCRSNPDQEEKDPEAAPLQDFTPRPSLAFPADSNPQAGGIKPGHWMTAAQSLKSNKNDARGELLSQASVAKQSLERGGSMGQVQDAKPCVPLSCPKAKCGDLIFAC